MVTIIQNNFAIRTQTPTHFIFNNADLKLDPVITHPRNNSGT